MRWVRLPSGPLIWKVAEYGLPGRFAKPCGLRALRVRIPCLPLDDWPDGEMEITPGFYPGSPGSNPGRANVRKCLITEGPPDWRREPVGSRSSILKMPCGFNSRSFRCGRVRCWFPETDCESVWQRFDSARSPLNTIFTSVLLGEQSASKTDVWGSNPHACAAAIAA